MIVASRLATVGRTVMPYATWAAYAIQLGYVGYNLYHYYQEYLAQVSRDQRSNTQRGLDETIEIVVARRRRRLERQQSNQSEPQRQQTTTIEEQFEQQQQLQESITEREGQLASNPAVSVVHIDESSPNNSDQRTPCSADNNDNRSPENQENSADLAEQIDRDRRSVHRAEPLSNYQAVNNEDDDEFLSDTSLSLESTDSNRGVINDMYSECFICARTLNDPNKQVATLPFCMHPFHKTCLDGVLKWHRKCPVCDFDIFSPI